MKTIKFATQSFPLDDYLEDGVKGSVLLTIDSEDLGEIQSAIKEAIKENTIEIYNDDVFVISLPAYNKLISLSLINGKIQAELVISDINFKEETLKSLDSLQTKAEKFDENVTNIQATAEEAASEISFIQEAIIEIYELLNGETE